MNATETHSISQPASEWAFKRTATNSFSEAIGAVGVIVLAIIGLTGVLSQTLAAIATIVVGAGILIEGGALASGYYSHRGVTAGFMGGVAGIVLGILALFATYPETLLAASVIVFGVTFLLASAAFSQMHSPGFQTRDKEEKVEAYSSDTSGQVLVGLGAVVLGILAIAGLASLTLVLVGLLSLGAAALFSWSQLGYRRMRLEHR